MLIILFAAVFGAVPAAADGEVPVKVLTLEDALRIALAKNKDIQKAKEYRRQVEGRYLEERAAALPQLQITGLVSRDRDASLQSFYRGLFPIEKEVRAGEIAISQPLYTFGRVGAAIRAAKMGLATAEDQLRIFQQAALRDVTASFLDILLARDLEALARQNLAQKERHLDQARRKFSAGVATEYDVLAAEVAVENARPEVIRTENLVRISRNKFEFLLGLGEPVDARGTLEAPLESPPAHTEAVRTAVQHRPELADLRKRKEVARELVKIYEAGNKPRVDLKAAWGWRQLVFGSMEGDGQAWNAGVYLTFPFFDGLRTQGKVMQAKADLNTLTLDEAKLLDTITLQTHDAVNACREASEIVRALSGTVKQAERLLFMAEKGYEFGVKTKLDVDDAELNLMQAKSNLARARRDYLVARTNLSWVTGTLAGPQP